MKNEVYDQCKNCRHFIQHYVIDGCRLLPIREGHCAFGVDSRFKMQVACASFENCRQIAAENFGRLLEQLKETENNINVIRHLLKKYGDLLAETEPQKTSAPGGALS